MPAPVIPPPMTIRSQSRAESESSTVMSDQLSRVHHPGWVEEFLNILQNLYPQLAFLCREIREMIHADSMLVADCPTYGQYSFATGFLECAPTAHGFLHGRAHSE